MSVDERRAAFSLAGIFSLRMLGLFMILPVFSLHAHEYAGHTPLLTGLAIGVYGLTQALFQIPFGMLSDRIGRKKVIAAGLIVFAVGSVVAALADTIWGVIGGRAMQGLGAIAAAVLALTADLTREEQRTKAMAIIGVSIGLAFAVAMVLGPAITETDFGLPGLFWLTAALTLGGVAVLLFYVPDP
ncbi:MAG TPA: MFS transporter, partial [Gammaproteobacteria bacterium]|nr:MFS transporter [Gammaproteobacteria bacterium]